MTPYQQAKLAWSLRPALDMLAPGTIVTPFPLIEEIVAKLPIKWDNPKLRFLDPACGRGAFLYVIKQKLLQAGHSEQHIVENMLYGIDINQQNVDVANFVVDPSGNYKNNIECADALKKEFKMKFDVITGNPPFQAELKTLQSRLWMQFVDKAFSLTKEGGFVGMISPSNWTVSPDLYEAWFARKNVLAVNIDECGRHFPGIGIPFSYYVIQNSPNVGQLTHFTSQTKLFTTKMPEQMIGTNLDALSILQKVLWSGHRSIGIAYAPQTHYSYRKAGKVSDVRTNIFKHKVLMSPASGRKDAQWVWGKTVCQKQIGPRVVIYTYPGTWCDMVTTNNLQTTHGFIHVPAKSMTEANNLKSYLSSKIITLVILATNSIRNINPRSVQQLPAVDLSRSWTDKALYKHFQLTKEEIKLIEETVK